MAKIQVDSPFKVLKSSLLSSRGGNKTIWWHSWQILKARHCKSFSLPGNPVAFVLPN